MKPCMTCQLTARRDAGVAPLWDRIHRTPCVHFHIVPRMADQPEDHRGAKVFAYLGVPEAERVGEERMNEIALKIQRLLSDKRAR